MQNGTTVPDHTDWHNLVFYHKLAKIVEQYVHKGDKLYVEGRIRYRTYDDKQGKRVYVTEIVAENMEMLTPRPQPSTQSAFAKSSDMGASFAPEEDKSKLPF